MKIIVTGGAGFIGSHLVEKLLKKNHNITVIDNLSTGRLSNINKFKKKVKFVKSDISKNNNWDKYFKNIDWVIHLAALADIVPSIQNPVNYFNSNVIGTLNVLQACRKYKIKKIIYSASSSCYGIPKKYPTSEKENIDPQYPYALTKRLGEELVMHWGKLYNLKCISLRFFNVYGTRSRTSGTYGAMFGVFLAQKIAKKPLTIVGDGNQTRDFVHVYDLVEATIKAAELGKKGEIYNVGGGKEISVNYIAKLIGGEKISIPKRPGEPDRSLADVTKIKSDFKWQPKISIDEGVGMLLKNIQDWKDAPVWTPKSIEEATKAWFKHLK